MAYIEDINSADDSAARRAAKRAGLRAKRSRWRRFSFDNFGGYQLVDTWNNFVVAGARFDMTAEEVIAFCEQR